MNEPVFGNIPIGSIRPSKSNPRKRFDEESLNDLANSIKTQGLGQPLLVRPLPNTDDAIDCVEIVAGERRYRACKIAGLEAIPAIVRIMSDAEVLEFQLVENLQREDVHPIEEAEGYERLMKEHNFTAEQCAEKVGKSKAYIYGRLKFLDLIPAARTAFFDGKLNASTAILIARIPVGLLQADAIASVCERADPMSYRAARDYIQNRYMLDLDEARFPINDVKLLPAAGSCESCPKRAGNAPLLFPDVRADVCTDPDCFASKGQAHDARILAKAKKAGIPIVEAEAADIYKVKNENPDLVLGSSRIWHFQRAQNAHDEHESVEELLASRGYKDLKPAKYIKLEDEVVAMYDKTAMQEALERAGLCLTIEKHAEAMREKAATGSDKSGEGMSERQAEMRAEHAKKVVRAEAETKFRCALYKKIRTWVSPTMWRVIAKSMLVQDYGAEFDLPDALFQDGTYTFLPDEISEYIDSAHPDLVELLIMDMLVGQALHVSTHEIEAIDDDDLEDDRPYQALIALAEAAKIDVDQVRLEVFPPAEVEANDEPVEQPAPKGKKKAAKKAKAAAAEEPVDAWPFPSRAESTAGEAEEAVEEQS